MRGLRQLPRLVWKLPTLSRLPRGSSRVIVIPGYRTNDMMTLALRSALHSRGHRVTGWGFGVNQGEVDAMLPQVAAMVRDVSQRTGERVVLVGWSNGGVFAREVARDEPEVVDQVITIGTPIWGGPRFSTSARFFSEADMDRIASTIIERNQIPIEVPVTAIWSRNDGIVDWRACVDDFSPYAENVEVSSGHVSALVDPDVLRYVATRVAEAPRVRRQ